MPGLGWQLCCRPRPAASSTLQHLLTSLGFSRALLPGAQRLRPAAQRPAAASSLCATCPGDIDSAAYTDLSSPASAAPSGGQLRNLRAHAAGGLLTASSTGGRRLPAVRVPPIRRQSTAAQQSGPRPRSQEEPGGAEGRELRERSDRYGTRRFQGAQSRGPAACKEPFDPP